MVSMNEWMDSMAEMPWWPQMGADLKETKTETTVSTGGTTVGAMALPTRRE